MPDVKLMSSLWKMAAHWNGAPIHSQPLRPLVNEGSWIRTMNLLTRGAMAVFGVQGLLTAQLIGDLATMATSLIPGVEVLILVVDSVWGTMLPFVELALGGSFISIVTVSSVRGCHVALSGVGDDLS